MVVVPQGAGTPFAVRDCALITLATGQRAGSLKEFREAVQQMPAGSLYHHFWGRLLRPQFDEPEYNNDFASWAWRGLHDRPLAERLSMVIPTDFDDLEGVRQEVLEIVDQRLGESEISLWSAADQRFYFLQGQIVVFDTGPAFRSAGGHRLLSSQLPHRQHLFPFHRCPPADARPHRRLQRLAGGLRR